MHFKNCKIRTFSVHFIYEIQIYNIEAKLCKLYENSSPLTLNLTTRYISKMSLRDSINDLIKSGELNKIPVEQPDCVRFIDSRAVSLQSSQQLVEKPVK